MEQQISPKTIDDQMQKSKNNKTPLKLFVLISMVVFLAFASVGVFAVKSDRPAETIRISRIGDSKIPELQPTPTPGLFYEMTIPYLRRREYKSSLGELQENSQKGNYISYLTSYDSDGNKVNAQLTTPTSDRPENGYPAIIFIHGYIPPASYRTLANYSDYVDYLARQGFVVFKIDLRGHGESGGEASGAYYSSDYIVDVLNAKAALQGYEQIDKNKIGLWGHSMAGNVVFRTIAVDPSIPVAVIWAGAVYSYEDWQKYGIQDGSYRPPANNEERQKRRQLLFDTHGEFSRESDFWKTVAAINYLSDIKTAIQLNHAVDDNVVNIGYSRDLNALLDKTSIPHEFHEYASGGHNISGNSFNAAMNNTVEFFKKYLE